ncbi:class E sortase [Streptomyces sp. TP-A0356]|uniref:class E sortase n=1 Tax=Streptomyces sp. TP-A0356 TaxID=1359208 RepID=UPI0006E36908|nr:class E sortase [Streptomyces sp. TP-A0356]
MTALRPERESGAAYGDAAEHGSSYGQQPYEGSGVWQGQGQGHEWSGYPQYPVDGAAGYGQQPYGQQPYGQQAPQPGYDATAVFPSYEVPGTVPPYGDDETVALRASDVEVARRTAERAGASAPEHGGRAARRRAARRHGRHGGQTTAGKVPETPGKPAGRPTEAPRSRMEARRAARAQKPGAAVLVSRVVGELFITTGVVMLLFVTYQLWWSNVLAHQEAGSAAQHLQQDWASGKRAPGAFAPGQGFAILHIPKLDVVAPIAEGTSKAEVLDKGMVGHYGEGSLKTAMPDARTGNFALAGHRNTHGEPFRYINRLQPGDAIVVETQDAYYVYKMTSTLPVTSPSNTSVLEPVPRGSGFTAPGRYITLTTCTPEFTSKYRLIVWGKMVEERPRSKGKPDALIS